MTIMETVSCEYCGKEVPKNEATFYEDAGTYFCPDCAEKYLTHCERCGNVIAREDAYRGFDGYLCECCHDDLFDSL